MRAVMLAIVSLALGGATLCHDAPIVWLGCGCGGAACDFWPGDWVTQPATAGRVPVAAVDATLMQVATASAALAIPAERPRKLAVEAWAVPAASPSLALIGMETE